MPGDWVHALAFAPDGGVLAAGIRSNSRAYWNPKTGRTTRIVSDSFPSRGAVVLWEPATGQPQRMLELDRTIVHALAFARGGAFLAVGTLDGDVILWDTSTDEPRPAKDRHPGPVEALAFSPDGRTLASGGGDVRLWDPATGELRQVLETPRGPVFALVFAPDGGTFATGHRPDTVILWDATGKQRRVLGGHRATVRAVALAGHGRMLASGDDDGRVILWDAATGEPLAVFPCRYDVMGLWFDPTGTRLHVADVAGTEGVVRTHRLEIVPPRRP